MLTEKKSALDSLIETFGDEPWLHVLASRGPDQLKGLAALAEGALEGGPLPVRIKHFMLFIVALARGLEETARLHADAANRLGATDEEWHEVLAVFLPSRGIYMYRDGARILGLGPAEPAAPSAADDDAPPKSTDEILAYFQQAMGTVPPFVSELLGRERLLQGYFALRSANLRDGILPQKYKELMLVALNTAERYQTGAEIHARAAMNCGATSEELLDAMTASILGGGVPGWIEGCQAFLRVTGGADAAASRD